MERITELSYQYIQGLITAEAYRSCLIAQLPLLDDVDTMALADAIALGMEP
jgi:hypothetical protein